MTAKTFAWGNTRPAKSRAIFKMTHYPVFLASCCLAQSDL
jgi:hypothetical protein